MNRIITDRPANGNVFNSCMRILNDMTGLQWGFVMGRHRVKYITSADLPIKIGAPQGRGYESKIKYTLDIAVGRRRPGQSVDDYEAALAAQLRFGLLNRDLDDELRNRISAFEIVGESAEMMQEALIQHQKHSTKGTKGTEYNAWINSAEQ